MTKPVSIDRYGVPIYAVNPSLGGVELVEKPKRYDVKSKKLRSVIYDEDTGVSLPTGSISIVNREYVDTEKFIKVFAAAMPVLEDLSKPAMKVFKGIWHQISKAPQIDRVELTLFWFQSNGFEEVTQGVLTRALKELREVEIIYKSTVPSMFYFNVLYFYNGCRVPAVNIYHQYINEDVLTEDEDGPFEVQGALEFDDEEGIL